MSLFASLVSAFLLMTTSTLGDKKDNVLIFDGATSLAVPGYPGKHGEDTWEKNHSISKGEEIEAPAVQNTKELLVKAGRKKTKEVATWFGTGLPTDALSAQLGTKTWLASSPAELNFAIQIKLTINGCALPEVRIGQGSHLTANNWWIAAPNSYWVEKDKKMGILGCKCSVVFEDAGSNKIKVTKVDGTPDCPAGIAGRYKDIVIDARGFVDGSIDGYDTSTNKFKFKNIPDRKNPKTFGNNESCLPAASGSDAYLEHDVTGADYTMKKPRNRGKLRIVELWKYTDPQARKKTYFSPTHYGSFCEWDNTLTLALETETHIGVAFISLMGMIGGIVTGFIIKWPSKSEQPVYQPIQEQV